MLGKEIIMFYYFENINYYVYLVCRDYLVIGFFLN